MSSTQVHEALPVIAPCFGDVTCQLATHSTNSTSPQPPTPGACQHQGELSTSNSATEDCVNSSGGQQENNKAITSTENLQAENSSLVNKRTKNGPSGSNDTDTTKKRKKSYGDEEDVELPPGTTPLAHQVAGHRKGPGSMVMLKCEGGHVLKHVQRPPKGLREVEFYRKVFDPHVTDSVLLSLRHLIPAFLGTLPAGPLEKVIFFKMADVTEQFVKPCISDIKMGKLTYDPLASAEKQRYELQKYPPGINLGFQMLGMRVYDTKHNRVDVYDRKYGRSLKEDEVIEKGLMVYFGGRDRIRRDAVRCMLGKLNQVKAWFESQCKLAFYASSLLLMYEGSELCQATDSRPDADNSNSGSVQIRKCQVCQDKCVADVKMIDFAHVFETTQSDENYLFGQRTLINMLEKLL